MEALVYFVSEPFSPFTLETVETNSLIHESLLIYIVSTTVTWSQEWKKKDLMSGISVGRNSFDFKVMMGQYH
jgi:hypothetical protein